MKIFCVLSILMVLRDVEAGIFEGYDNVEAIDEGSCAALFPEANVNLNFINERQPLGGFYLGFNSQFQALTLAESILGRNITKDDDPQYYCLRLDWKTSADGKIDSGHFYAFGKNTSSVICSRLDIFGNKHTCQIEKNGKLFPPATAHWTLTDQETYIVIVICDGNQKKSWNVISTQRILDVQVKKVISAHVQKLGFNPKHFNTVDYSSCQN